MAVSENSAEAGAWSGGTGRMPGIQRMITRAEYDHVAILLEDRSGKLHIFEAVGALRHPCDAMLCTPHACTLVPYLTRPAQVLLRTSLPWPLRSPKCPAGNSSDLLAARRADRLRRVVYTQTRLSRFPTRRFHNSDIRRLFRLCAAQRMLMRGTSDPPAPPPPPPILSYPNLIRSDSEPIPAVHVRETPQNRRPAFTSPHRRNRALLAWAVSCA
jgi:hypothetical protein